VVQSRRETARSVKASPLAGPMRMLNLGCGCRVHPDWTNVDAVALHPTVQEHDLSQGIPFADNTFDVVYHSHFLEHLPREQAWLLMRECHRVLTPGGILRVAVPDLEGVARLYLQALEGALAGYGEWQHNYEWMMIELLDQTVRESSGGAMAEYLGQKTIPNLEFVRRRTGSEGRRMMAGASDSRQVAMSGSTSRKWLRDLLARLRAKGVRMALGEADFKALELGRFRMSGEVHHWSYDRYSLAVLLKRAGFCEPKAVGPSESRIHNWSDYSLDTERDGSIYKPHSLYMEAVRPGASSAHAGTVNALPTGIGRVDDGPTGWSG